MKVKCDTIDTVAKELTQSKRVANMLVIGDSICKMVLAMKPSRTGESMQDTMLTDASKVKESILGPTGHFMMVNGTKIKITVLASITGQMAANIMEIGQMVLCMAQEFIFMKKTFVMMAFIKMI